MWVKMSSAKLQNGESCQFAAGGVESVREKSRMTRLVDEGKEFEGMCKEVRDAVEESHEIMKLWNYKIMGYAVSRRRGGAHVVRASAHCNARHDRTRTKRNKTNRRRQ